MKKNRAKLYDLQVGDRFYFVADKRRQVWQVEHMEQEQSSYMPWVTRTRYYLVADDGRRKEEKYDLPVVWLRKA